MGRVLGQDPEKVVRSMGLSPDETQTVIGIPRFPIDPDGVVRGYRGDFADRRVSAARMNSLARAVAEQYSPALHVTKKEVLFNFAGKAGRRKLSTDTCRDFSSAANVSKINLSRIALKMSARDAGPPKLPYLINKIVLVSGAYRRGARYSSDARSEKLPASKCSRRRLIRICTAAGFACCPGRLARCWICWLPLWWSIYISG